MSNLDLFNRLWTRLRYNNTQRRYSTDIPFKKLLGMTLNGYFAPSQDDKPSPTGPFTYRQWTTYLPSRLPKAWKLSRSFVGWTNSMEPTLDYGDMLVRVPYKEYKRRKGKLREGCIAIYEDGIGQRIVHRYIGKTSGGRFVFRGDNNFRIDPPVREEQIKDVVVQITYTWDKVLEGKD